MMWSKPIVWPGFNVSGAICSCPATFLAVSHLWRATNVSGTADKCCRGKSVFQSCSRSTSLSPRNCEVVQDFHVQWELHERDTPIPAPVAGEAPVDRNHRRPDRLRCQSHPDLCHE